MSATVRGVGKTMLAKQAVRRYLNDRVFPGGFAPMMQTDEQTPIALAANLAKRFHIDPEEPPDGEEARGLISGVLRDRVCLVWLDNVRDWELCQYLLPVSTGALILVATRNRELFDRIRLFYTGKNTETPDLPLEMFSDEETAELFRKMPGKTFCEGEQETYLKIADRPGRLPIALKQAVTLMTFGPKHTAATLLKKLAGEKQARTSVYWKRRLRLGKSWACRWKKRNKNWRRSKPPIGLSCPARSTRSIAPARWRPGHPFLPPVFPPGPKAPAHHFPAPRF